MILDFWNTKLNPVTMQPRESDAMYSASNYKKKSKTDNYTSKDLSLNQEYITAKKAIEVLGIGAKTISMYLRKIGIERIAYKSGDTTYYRVEDVNKIVLKSKVNSGPTDEYISSKDLQVELNLTINQLFRMAQQKKWKKVRFNKNIVYYLKDQVLK